jgi:type IV pilus assembly protein PilF
MINSRSGLSLFLLLGLMACAQAPTTPESGRPELVSAREENYQAKVHTDLAVQYYLLRKHAVALQESQIALKADPRYARAYNLLGLVYGDLGEDAQAEANFRRAIELSPQYSEARNDFGYFLCQRGRYDESIVQFDAALTNTLYATPEKALANAGYCLLRKGDLARAEGYVNRALARAPGQPMAIYAMAELQYGLGNPIGARNRLRQLMESGELDASGLWLGVRVERMLGNRESEANYASQLRRRYPESKETRWLFNGQYDMPGGRQ